MFPDTTRILATPDLDGDGDADAIGWWGYRNSQTIVYGYLNDGEGRYGQTFAIVRNDIGTAARHWWSLETGRFDGDDNEGFFTRFGQRLIRNTRFHRDGGERRQYGEAGVGLGGAIPNLGAIGPFRVGEVASTILTGLPGGAFGGLIVGLEPVDLNETPLPGLSLYVYPPLVAMPFTVAGTVGDVGEGRFSVNGNIAVVIRTSAIAVRLNIPLGGAFAKLKPSHPKEVSSYPSAGGIYRICQSELD